MANTTLLTKGVVFMYWRNCQRSSAMLSLHYFYNYSHDLDTEKTRRRQILLASWGYLIPGRAGDIVPSFQISQIGALPRIPVPLFTPSIRAKKNWQNTSDPFPAQHKSTGSELPTQLTFNTLICEGLGEEVAFCKVKLAELWAQATPTSLKAD